MFDSVVQGGDSVWEGLRIYKGKIFKLEEHLDRLVILHFVYLTTILGTETILEPLACHS